MSGVQLPFGTTYETVAASQTAQVLGQSGAVGDTIIRLIVTVNTTASSTVTILDNATSIAIMPALTPVGVYSIDLGVQSVSGPWKVTTGAGATVVAVGNFS
jgi:ABC-type thiamine transport system ATPase subunit